MKEKRFLILGILAVIAAVITLCSALLMPVGESKDTSAQYRVAVLLPQDNSPFYTRLIRGIEEYTDETVSLQVTQYPYTDTQEQRLRFEMAVAAAVDGIIVQFSDRQVAGEMIKKAEGAGIPVVLVNSDAQDSGRQFYVGSDHYEMGRQAARLLHEATGGKAQIALICGLENQDSHIQRIRGFREELEQWPAMQIICVEYTQMDSLRAAQTVQNLLKAYPEINSFVGVSAADMEGIIKAFDAKLNRDAYRLVGMEDSAAVVEAIEKEAVLSAITQDPVGIGRSAAQLLGWIMTGRIEQGQIIRTDILTVTKGTLEDYEQWTRERNYG